MPVTLYAEDLVVGAVHDLGDVEFSREDIVEFGRRWDPLYLHTDEGRAANGPFGGLIASGIHTLAAFQRTQADAFMCDLAVIAGRGFESMRLLRPVRPGDSLRAAVEIRGVKPRADGSAVVLTGGTLTAPAGALVFEVLGDLLVAGRPDGNTDQPMHTERADR